MAPEKRARRERMGRLYACARALARACSGNPGASGSHRGEAGVPLAFPRGLVLEEAGGRLVLLRLAEIGEVELVRHHRQIRRRELQLKHGLPIEAREPRARLEVLHAARPHREAVAGLRPQQRADELRCAILARGRKVDAVNPSQHLGIDEHRIGRDEGWLAREELEKQDAEAPPIQGVCVPAGVDDLWREVIGRAARREGLPDNELRQAHVRQPHIAAFC
eukprot:CAMPEP_0176299034 /NCGR_PEP_ID=MMETSP0121_2-20121125/59576_1 /TAXON_ID=160619 /ORGANISM="Kryptoperidinium foliaceum, Strain CCMP 1326" /LENGTH=220 /DNA_ID=CAMNT_0017640335 /DNA_START=50 /DNA_END=712 /DNA_ORIENTATION=+